MKKLKSILAFGGYLALAATLFMNTAALSADYAENYDVNGDGVINVMDLVSIRNFLLGYRNDEKPAEKPSEETAKDEVYYDRVYGPVIRGLSMVITDFDPDEPDGIGGELGGAQSVMDVRQYTSVKTAQNLLGYAITDINGDGVCELLIGEADRYKDGKGYGSHIYTVYTCKNDQAEFLTEGYYRNAYYYAGNGSFVYSGSGGASLTLAGKRTLSSDTNELVWDDFYFTDYTDEAFRNLGLYRNTTGDCDKSVSEEVKEGTDKLDQIIKEYNGMKKEVELTLFSSVAEFSDYEPVSAEKSEFLKHNYSETDTYKASESEHAAEIIFYATEKVTDFKFLKLNAEMNGDNVSYKPEAVYSQDVLSEERALLVKLDLPEVLPYNGISYKDKNGEERMFILSVSGKDGSVILKSVSNPD